MTTITDPQPVPAEGTPARAGAAVRDIRLDFFRGIALFVIMISHMPGNSWGNWIPGRLGFSDATEMFVFCSGMASAIAFGRAFDRHGWWIGAARVSFRCWQIYWMHIALFFVLAAMLAAWDLAELRPEPAIGTLNLWKFFEDTGSQLVGLFTLTYVPNFFDILPMYMVILAMLPLMMALARVSVGLVAVAVVGVWLLAQSRLLEMWGLSALHVELPAEPWSDREWFFNPFAWQLCFFTGFALMRGWLPRPPVTPLLMGVALAVLLASLTVSHAAMREFGWEWARDWRIANLWAISKTEFGLIRYIHFLALAYLAWVLAGDGGRNLVTDGDGPAHRAWGAVRRQILKVGQQSLAVFVMSMIVSRIFGLTLELTGHNAATIAAANLVGFAVLILTAHIVTWYKSQPWRQRQ